jgi:hypothetical protein
MTDAEALTEFYDSHGIDDWDDAQLFHYEEDDVWEARFDGASGRGNSQIDALDALVDELRD